MLLQSRPKIQASIPRSTKYTSCRGKVVGLQPVLEGGHDSATLFPVRVLFLLSEEWVDTKNSFVPIVNEQVQDQKYANSIFVEHIFQADPTSVIINECQFERVDEIWKAITTDLHNSRAVMLSQASVYSRPLNSVKDWEVTELSVQHQTKVIVNVHDFYQRKRKSDDKPFLNKAGEYMHHARFIQIDQSNLKG